MLLSLLLLLHAPPPDLVALGIVVSARPERSVAILRAEGRTRVVGIGGTAFGGRVAAIAPGSVALEFGDERIEVRLAGGEPTAPLVRPPIRANPARSTDPPEDPTTPARAMERREVERRLSDELTRILSETTLVPVTDGGVVVGFTLTRIPQGSLLTDAGLRPGDVLTRINDTPIDGMATLIGLWPRLQTESVLRAVVLRGGRPVSLTVTLR
jgi:type II secretion system protein C